MPRCTRPTPIHPLRGPFARLSRPPTGPRTRQPCPDGAHFGSKMLRTRPHGRRLGTRGEHFGPRASRLWTRGPHLWTHGPRLWTRALCLWTRGEHPWTRGEHSWTRGEHLWTQMPHIWSYGVRICVEMVIKCRDRADFGRWGESGPAESAAICRDPGGILSARPIAPSNPLVVAVIPRARGGAPASPRCSVAEVHTKGSAFDRIRPRPSGCAEGSKNSPRVIVIFERTRRSRSSGHVVIRASGHLAIWFFDHLTT